MKNDTETVALLLGEQGDDRWQPKGFVGGVSTNRARSERRALQTAGILASGGRSRGA